MSDRPSTERERYEQYQDADWARQRPDWLETWRVLEEASRPTQRARRRGRRHFRWQRWLLVPGLAAALALLVLGALYSFEWRFQGRILPNVYVAGINLGETTPEDALATLRLHYERFQKQPLSLVYEGRIWRPSGEEIGLQIAWETAVEEAMAIGRQGSSLEQWKQRWQTWNGRYDLLLPASLDNSALRGYLEGLARTIDRPPMDAALAVEDQDVYVRPGTTGRELQIVPCETSIKNSLATMSLDPIQLTVHVIPPDIDEQAATSAVETARKMLSGPIILRVGEDTWTLTIEDIGEMLTIARGQDGGYDTLRVVLDQNALYEYASGIADKVRVHPRNAHFRFNGDQLEIIDEGKNGRELSIDAAVALINEAVLSNQRQVDLHVAEVLPDIRRETIEELGIKELVGAGESYFVGSRPYRLHNIATAARILDGTLIAPGETFSFIESIGAIDEEDGFVQGYSIIGGRTVLNVGGGVCQVSTTVFRAAFFAGLPITERHAHDFRVSYYEQGSILGFDATIFTSTGTDLKFRNDTAGYLLMQFEVYTHSGYMQVFIYGTKPNREVQLEGPYQSNWTPAPTEPVYVDDPSLPPGTVQQTDWARDGLDAVIYRHILLNGEIVSSETFYSHYQAWPNVYAVGPNR